jgi:hypothetical protein
MTHSFLYFRCTRKSEKHATIRKKKAIKESIYSVVQSTISGAKGNTLPKNSQEE